MAFNEELQMPMAAAPATPNDYYQSRFSDGETIDAILTRAEEQVITHRLRTYTALEQIGITPGSETIETIVDHLSEGAKLIFNVGQTSAKIYPTQYGLCEVTFLNGDRIKFEYDEKNGQSTAAGAARKHIAFAFKADTVLWSGWQRLATTGQLVNPNLLDNWYFIGGGGPGAFPVNQRDGRICLKGTQAYGTPDCSGSPIGPTANPADALEFVASTGNYKMLNVGTNNWYVKAADAVCGYTGVGYGIDRWRIGNPGITLTLHDGYITMTSTGRYQWLEQRIESYKDYYGKTVTVSALVRGPANGAIGIGLGIDQSSTVYGRISVPTTGNWQVATTTVTLPELTTQLGIMALLYPGYLADNSGGSADFIAAKLELGTQQTLAHQDASGKWVLNEIPNYGEQLARCQRYYQKFGIYDSFICISSTGETASDFVLPLSVPFRAHPVVLENGGVGELFVAWYNGGNLCRMRINNRTATFGEVIGFAQNAALSADL